jgi:two-component system sensor histidine kinase UhpB
VNAVVLTGATLALAVSPATVSFPLAVVEAVVLCVGLSALLVVNFVLLRRVMLPLERLTSTMRGVHPLESGARVRVDEGTPELRQLGAAFNEMLERLEHERRESGRRALAVQEGERLRLSRELHDEVGQTLTGVLLELEGITGEGSPTRLVDAREGVRASLEELRAIARRLRPAVLDDLGLSPALRSLAAQVSRPVGLDLVFDSDPRLPELSPEEELAVYRIAQEALTNAVRHADPVHADLKLRVTDGTLELLVRDDGCGFDPDAATQGTGVRGMRERAMLVGGELDVATAAGGGTQVVLRLPLSR